MCEFVCNMPLFYGDFFGSSPSSPTSLHLAKGEPAGEDCRGVICEADEAGQCGTDL